MAKSAAQERRAKKREGRERKRLERKVRQLEAHADNFENDLNDNEATIMRLDALPEDLRHDNHDDQREQHVKNCETLRLGIDKSLDEADRLREELGLDD